MSSTDVNDPIADLPTDASADDAMLAEYARTLADAIDQWFPGWVEQVFEDLLTPEQRLIEASTIEELTGPVSASLTEEVRALLEIDIDQQRANPLAILRRPAGAISEVLRRSGVPESARDADARRLHPDDLYDLGPASFSDVHPKLHDAGLAWGAAKAHVHLRRRRAEGQR